MSLPSHNSATKSLLVDLRCWFAASLVCFTVGCSDESEAGSSAPRTQTQVLFLPGAQNEYINYDVQIEFEIQNQYLESWFTQPGDGPVFDATFMANINDMSAAPSYEEDVDYDAHPEFALISYYLAPKDMLEINANPSHPEYSPSIRIGVQPVSEVKFGLDVRYNQWLDFSGGPTNEFYSKIENGDVVATALCLENFPGDGTPRFCILKFQLEGFDAELADSRFAPFVQVSVQRSKLSEWSVIKDVVGRFLRERSQVVPFEAIQQDGMGE